ncbi:MAG TPA: CpsD/CapB family tyrosine-protein kinase [Haliangiales bacterium]|nr:CpsD/CapB family tyrosine-protein kinase [Haliangiales bacterium]
MSDERRGRRDRPGNEFAEPEVTLPRAVREAPPRSTTKQMHGVLPPPPAGMPLPAPAVTPPVQSRAPTQPQPTIKADAADRPPETTARQAAHAAAQLTQLAQPAAGPTVRNTTVFHKASDSSDLVRVHRMAPTRRMDPRLLMLGAPDSAAAASFRVLRHRLGERKGVKAILVTSPRAGEGKTLCAVNLALAMGEAGRARVLLLEANFRCPSVARLLGFYPPMGVCEQLDAHRLQPAQPWIVVETVAPWLHTAAVAPEMETRPILDGPALARCIEDMRRAGYDYIVIDSPPILGSADVNLIEESVDGIVIAMWARKSRARALRKAVDQIGRSKLLGVVLLGT